MALQGIPMLVVTLPNALQESWSLVESVSVVALIIAFGIAATACTVRHDV
jgi:hypothetical protein